MHIHQLINVAQWLAVGGRHRSIDSRLHMLHLGPGGLSWGFTCMCLALLIGQTGGGRGVKKDHGHSHAPPNPARWVMVPIDRYQEKQRGERGREREREKEETRDLMEGGYT